MFDDLVFVLFAVVYVAAFYNCYRILNERRTPSSAFAWILFHISLPVVAFPIYMLVGGHRIRGYVKRHQTLTDGEGSEADRYEKWERLEHLDLDKLGSDFPEFERIFENVGPLFRAQPGEVDLLIDGKQTFESIFAAIKNARKYIFVQYYVLRSDRLGIELKELLIEKQKQGVHIFLLYDDMGSFWISREYVRGLRKAGVQIARFLPVTSFTRFFQINFRNHRKLVIVDGEVAFTGGLNVGEEYAHGIMGAKKRRYRWRDTHVRLTGRAVQKLEETFLDDWCFATGSRPVTSGFREDVQVIRHSLESFRRDENALRVVPTGPADQQLISVLLMTQLIVSAKTRLWIATPYFIPDPTLLRALELAALKGVDVRVLIPSRADHRFVQWVSLSYAEQVQSSGIRVCLYKPGFMHQKIVLVDEHTVGIGTMNLDNRALYLNFETTIVVHGKNFNQRMAGVLQEDFVNSEYYTVEVNWWRQHFIRLRAGAARLLAPLL